MSVSLNSLSLSTTLPIVGRSTYMASAIIYTASVIDLHGVGDRSRFYTNDLGISLSLSLSAFLFFSSSSAFLFFSFLLFFFGSSSKLLHCEAKSASQMSKSDLDSDVSFQLYDLKQQGFIERQEIFPE